MIIECHTCHTRFRLDESRIKGKGARVKCRKCGDSIVVLKDSAAAPRPRRRAGAVSSTSAPRCGIPPTRVPVPAPGRQPDPFPAPFRPPGPFAAEPSSPALEASEPGKDEIELAFDKILSVPAEASPPSIGETEAEIPVPPPEASVPVEHAAATGEGPRPELDLGSLTLDLGPEEKLELPPSRNRSRCSGNRRPSSRPRSSVERGDS